MSHAAGAIDAMFSRGMANTMAVIEAFVPLLLEGLSQDDLSADRFAYIEQINQQILDNNDKLIAGSYISFRDFELWSAWSKVWFWAWNLGVIRIAGSYYRYLESGRVEVLNELHENLPAPGTFLPEAASSQELFESVFQIMLDVESGKTGAKEAVPILSGLLGSDAASLKPLNLHEVLRRWHDGSVEAQERMYAWGRAEAPEELRSYFDYDRATISRAAELVISA